MTASKKLMPFGLVAAGLLGIVLFFVAHRTSSAFLPSSDFAKGLWVGLCLGLELLGGACFLKMKRERAIS